jgi:hypothetical protein
MVLLLLPLSPARSLSLSLSLYVSSSSCVLSSELASERALNRTAIAGRREERLETFCCNIESITANYSRNKKHTCQIQQVREFLRGGSRRRRCKKGGKRWQGLREQVEGVHRRGGGHQTTLIVEEEEVEEEEQQQQQQQEHLRRRRPWPWEAWHRHLLYLAWVLPFKCIAILQVPNKGSSSVV